MQRREDAAFARLQSIALFGDSSSILNPYASQSLEIRRVVGTQEIQPLPIGGRNFVDFVKVSSGVAPGRENVGGGPFKKPDAGVGPAAVPRQSFGGQTGSIRWYRSMNSITRKPSPACLAPRPPSKRPASFVCSTAAASLRTDGRWTASSTSSRGPEATRTTAPSIITAEPGAQRLADPGPGNPALHQNHTAIRWADR